MKLNTGQLNQNIGIYQQVNEDDGYGNSTSTDVLYWQTVASVTPIKSQRTLQANQEIVKSAFQFVCRFRNDKFIESGMTIQYRGKRFAIISTEADYTNREYISLIGRADELPQR